MWAWPPKETRRLDGWLLRAAGGHTRRANSVQALVFAADTDLSRAMEQVEAWYGARGLAACYQVTDHAAPARLDEALAARRYTRLPSVSILTGDLASLEPPKGIRIELEFAADAARHELALRSALAARATPCAGRVVRPHSATAQLRRADRRPAAGGGALVVVDRDVAGIFSLRTAVPARGRGYARAVVSGWARGRAEWAPNSSICRSRTTMRPHSRRWRPSGSSGNTAIGTASYPLRRPEPDSMLRSARDHRACSDTSR